MAKIPAKSKGPGIQKSGKEKTIRSVDYSEFKRKFAPASYIALVVISIAFLFSVFKNISYPLFWADESMTAMGTERVLQFGYPKVHDGKNVLYDLRNDNPTLGIHPKDDAYIGGAGWAQYYFGIVGYKLAAGTDDLFTKSGIFRSTFAIAGLVGIFLFGFMVSGIFRDRFARYSFLAFYIFLELLSVSLALMIREVRYYSLAILLVSMLLGMYAVFRFYKPFNKYLFVGLSVALLWFLFNTFAPVFFIVAASIGLTEFILFLITVSKGNLKKAFLTSLPALLILAISAISVIPLLGYFNTFEIAKEMNIFNNYNSDVYWTNVGTVIQYFRKFELLWLMVIVKILSFIYIKNYIKEKTNSFQISSFLTLFFIVFVFLIARIPNFIYTRYIIYLQPVISLIILLDIFSLIKEFTKGSSRPINLKMAGIAGVFGLGVIISIISNMESIKGHLFELTHPYQGPLDYTIPYLYQQYPESDTLVIAANYEESSFMYYLKSKVVMGFTGNNLAQDSLSSPDVLAYRKTWGNYASAFNHFIQSAPFEPQKFPVKDNPVNNIPELNFKPAFNHQFRTLLPVDDKDATYLYLRK